MSGESREAGGAGDTSRSRGPKPVVLVDARNVQRSTWPNIPDRELVERARLWAGGRFELVLVFDGEVSEGLAAEAGVEIVATGAGSADDWIAREAGALRAAGRPFCLATSDRGLRDRSSAGAVETIGGGTLARELLAIRL